MLKNFNATKKIVCSGGAKFWAYIASMNKTSEILTKWTIILEHTTSNWTGSITSDDPEKLLETPNLSGVFKVKVTAEGNTFKEITLVNLPDSNPDVGCNDNCISMIGIIATEDGKSANYWTVWNAISPSL